MMDAGVDASTHCNDAVDASIIAMKRRIDNLIAINRCIDNIIAIDRSGMPDRRTWQRCQTRCISPRLGYGAEHGSSGFPENGYSYAGRN
jgi:hypothetical protein